MSPLERRTRPLLWLYPAAYRRERGEEIIGTLLEDSGYRVWPRLLDVRALVVGSVKARAAQNKRRTAGVNIRAAVMSGLAIWLSTWVCSCLSDLVFFGGRGGSPPPPLVLTLASVLFTATVLLAWTGPRVGVGAAALAGSAVMVHSVTAFIGWFGALSGISISSSYLVGVVCLAGLAALAPATKRPSASLLWLPGLIAVGPPLYQVAVRLGWFGPIPVWPGTLLEQLGVYVENGIPAALLLAGGAAGIAWVAIDARLIVAMLTYFALEALEHTAHVIPGPAFTTFLPTLIVLVALIAAAVWMLRRQSARPSRVTS